LSFLTTLCICPAVPALAKAVKPLPDATTALNNTPYNKDTTHLVDEIQIKHSA